MDAFRKGIDVFVSTPPKLLSLTKYDSVKHPKALLGSVGFSVVDEADTLMDGSFIQDTYGILRNLPNLNTLVFASATIPAEFNRVVHKLFSDVVSITTPALHKLPKAIEFRVMIFSITSFSCMRAARFITVLVLRQSSSSRGWVTSVHRDRPLPTSLPR